MQERTWTCYENQFNKREIKKLNYDVAVIGGGPNGLACAAYLAKAGKKVVIIDRRNEVGGGIATEEATAQGGFRHNIHAVYFMMVDYAPVYKDLALEEYDLEHIYPELQIAMPLLDGSSLCLYSDVEKSCDSIARFSKKDADAYRRIYEEAKVLTEEFLAPATYAPAIPALDALVMMQTQEVGRKVHEYSEKSPIQVVNEVFENERVKALMLYLLCMWGLDPNQTGVGYLIPLYFNRSVNFRLVSHGSHVLAQSLNKAFLENGGHVLAPYNIKRIIIENGKAVGLDLEGGVEIRAEAVVSTIDPSQTFFKLVGKEHLNEDFAESSEGWIWEHWSLLGTHLALDEAPRFTAAADNPDLNNALVYVLGYESPEDFMRHYEAMARGETGEKIGFNCCFPTIHDPSQAPKGRHTAILSRMAPYDLKEGKDRWYNYNFRQEEAKRSIDLLRKYAPNLSDDKIRGMYISTPVDVQNKYLDMVKGSIKQGQYHPLQMGYMRPNEHCSTHKTPIEGLYMGGACVYPGGTVIFGPGYLAANRVAEDLGIEKWWKEPEMVTKAKEKGLL